jgi:hypothetical protein
MRNEIRLGNGDAESQGVNRRTGQGIGEFCHWPSRDDTCDALSGIFTYMAQHNGANQMKTAYEKQLEWP